MIPWPALPYELIGRVTVALIALVALGVAILIWYVIGYAIWWRGLTKLVNLMWRGYDFHGEHPPEWRLKIAVYALAIQQKELDKIPDLREELEQWEGSDEDKKP